MQNDEVGHDNELIGGIDVELNGVAGDQIPFSKKYEYWLYAVTQNDEVGAQATAVPITELTGPDQTPFV